jgi:hypothetical protein
MFEEECAANGATSTMREFIAQHVAERKAANL